jgi:chromosome segregation ATPase
LGGVQSEGVGNYEKALNAQSAAKSKILEITAKITELENEQAESGESKAAQIAELSAELEQQRKIQALTTTELQNSSALLAQMGIQINGNLTDEQAALAIATVKLNLENQAIAIKLQQETISTRLKQLEQDRLILELQRQATSEEIGEKEKANIQAQIANAQAQKALLAEQLAASTQLAGLQQANNTQAARTDLAAQGIDPQDLGASLKAANDELATKVDQSFTNQLGKLSQALAESDKANRANWEGQTQRITAGLGANAQTVSGAINPLASGINALGGNLSQGFGITVQATQTQTAQLQGEIRAMNQSILNLPGNIARLLPRPSSQAR